MVDEKGLENEVRDIPYYRDALSQEFHRLFIRMVFEVLIEGKHRFDV